MCVAGLLDGNCDQRRGEAGPSGAKDIKNEKTCAHTGGAGASRHTSTHMKGAHASTRACTHVCMSCIRKGVRCARNEVMACVVVVYAAMACVLAHP